MLSQSILVLHGTQSSEKALHGSGTHENGSVVAVHLDAIASNLQTGIRTQTHHLWAVNSGDTAMLMRLLPIFFIKS